MEDKVRFINYINDHYQEIYNSFLAFCNNKNYKFDADIFQDTILKCYKLIEKQGFIKDKTEQGMKNYFFMAFKQNLQRETQYSRNQKRDHNISNVGALYEAWYNATSNTVRDKIVNDLRKDYFTLYLLKKVEENFDEEHFYLFRLKTFTNMTYAKLAEKTGIKGVRQKVVDVKNFLKQNVSKKEIEKAFENDYGEFFEL